VGDIVSLFPGLVYYLNLKAMPYVFKKGGKTEIKGLEDPFP
jgi:hypothetical protein